MVSLLPNPAPPSDPSAHMVVCGDDGLAHRLAAELRGVYREQVVLVVPPSRLTPPQPMAGRARAASAALFGRMVTAVNRGTGGSDDTLVPDERLMEAAEPTEAVLADAGVDRAAALALVYDDDETNIRAALTARRSTPGCVWSCASTTGGSASTSRNSSTRPPNWRAARPRDAGSRRRHRHHRAVRRRHHRARARRHRPRRHQQGRRRGGIAAARGRARPPRPGEVADPGLCTLALLSATSNDPAGAEGSEDSGDGPQMLPDAEAVAAATGRGTVVLEQVSYSGPRCRPGAPG